VYDSSILGGNCHGGQADLVLNSVFFERGGGGGEEAVTNCSQLEAKLCKVDKHPTSALCVMLGTFIIGVCVTLENLWEQQ
jgi:hypothetical protein